MDNNEEIIDNLIKKTSELEKREIKYPDYMPQFEALKIAIGQLNFSYPAEQIQNTITGATVILDGIQNALPVKIRHQFDFRTKGWIIAGMILLIVIAICTGLCGYLWTENNRLHAVDVKYRLLHQVSENNTEWADSVYKGDPEKTEKTVTQMERGQLQSIKTVKVQKPLAVKRIKKRRLK